MIPKLLPVEGPGVSTRSPQQQLRPNCQPAASFNSVSERGGRSPLSIIPIGAV